MRPYDSIQVIYFNNDELLEKSLLTTFQSHERFPFFDYYYFLVISGYLNE